MSQTTATSGKSFLKLLLPALIIFTKSSKIISVLKVLKFGKPLIIVVSMLISAIAYGIWLGPWFGIGLVAMIFIHEMGHVIALRMKGMETPGPVFIPFLGAAIFIKDVGDRDTEAFIGYGGPLLGTIGALACAAAVPFTDGKTAEILFLVSYIGIFLNLFNMIPISPLDGGRITQAVGAWFKWMGLALVISYILFARQPAIILILILVLDAFERMPLWLRPAIAGLLAVVMATLMVLGYSSQPLWVDVLDVFLAGLFTWMFWRRDKARGRGEKEVRDERAYPSASVRMKWLACYIGLTALLVTVLWYQTGHMPEGVTKPKEPVVQVQ